MLGVHYVKGRLSVQHAAVQGEQHGSSTAAVQQRYTHLWQLQRVVADHAQLAAGEGGHKGAAPGGDQDVARRHTAPPHIHGVCVHQLAPALDVLRAGWQYKQGGSQSGKAVRSSTLLQRHGRASLCSAVSEQVPDPFQPTTNEHPATSAGSGAN